jgi:hypothetical protein
LVWFGRTVTDFIVGTLVPKAKVVLIIIYIASSFFYKYFRVFLSPLVANPDYLIRGRAEVHGIPAIRYNK